MNKMVPQTRDLWWRLCIGLNDVFVLFIIRSYFVFRERGKLQNLFSGDEPTFAQWKNVCFRPCLRVPGRPYDSLHHRSKICSNGTRDAGKTIHLDQSSDVHVSTGIRPV